MDTHLANKAPVLANHTGLVVAVVALPLAIAYLKRNRSSSSSSRPGKASGPSTRRVRALLVPFVSVLVLGSIVVFNTWAAGDSVKDIPGNAFLFSPFLKTATEYWNKVVDYENARTYEHTHVPIIQAADYSFESLRKVTNNFRSPAIVRGMFLDTVAQKRWLDPEYLSSKIGEFIVPVVQKAELQNQTLPRPRSAYTFREAYTEILTQEDSKKYIFIPVSSRFRFAGAEGDTAVELKPRINQIVHEDLNLDRIWKGFGTENHRNFYGSQLIVGRGTNDSETTTGTGWHCAPGNNWFVQVAGKKLWHFMDPKYSKWLKPVRNGMKSIRTSDLNMSQYHDKLPLQYAHVRAGDLLYNPDWQWHTITNYAGLSIGVPIREFNVTLSVRNNMHYTLVVAANFFFDGLFGIDLGGEHDKPGS